MLKVTIGQFTISMNENFGELFEESNGIKYKNPQKNLKNFHKGAKVARQDKANFLVLPELFLPSHYLKTYIVNEAENSNIIIIGGLEWEKRELNGQGLVDNHAFIAIPSVLDKDSSIPGSGATVIKVPKMFPAPEEEQYLNDKHYEFQKNNKLYLFKSTKLGNWAVLICFDYLNLPIQQMLQGRIQTLFVVAFNKDLSYFHTMSDTLNRILFCNVIVCNCGDFGGSHSFTPYRKAYHRQRYEIKGNKVDSATTITLPLKSLAKEQKASNYNRNGEFIHKPANYSCR